ncbi:MAG TPA: HPF/RaiA family ribosome-associated protein [Solirubrobacterales bacterium]|nr:HPF/RaiA family ribosome-associated protein [Solirubrobacterales bacterium]
MIEVDVTVRGEVPDEAREHAVEKLGALDRLVAGEIRRVRVVLTEEPNPRIERSSRAEGDVDLNGPVIRVSVADIEPIAAINQLAHRLERQLRRWIDRRTDLARRGTERDPGEWRHADFEEGRPDHYPRPPAEREVVRRKTFATRPITPEEAAVEMEDLDHDFYLFTGVESGADAVAYHRDDGRLGVIGPSGIGWSGERGGIVLEESRMDGPQALDAVIAEMDALNHRFMYFTNAETGRGNVIYVRYDGHYGLIEPMVD